MVLDSMKDGKTPFEQMTASEMPLLRIVERGFRELIRNKAEDVGILKQSNPE
jgi:hypothetical protein